MSKKVIVPLAALAFLVLVGMGVWYLQVTGESQTAIAPTNTSTADNTITVRNYSVTLAYQQGDVWLSTNDTDWEKVETDTILHEGDGIKTGENSKAILEFENGDVVRLAESTEISLVYTNEIAVTLLQSHGQTYNRVTKNLSRIYQVVSNVGSAQALGTAFDVQVTDKFMDVYVVESTVKVKVGTSEEQVAQGKTAKFAKDGTAAEVSDIDSEMLKNDWYAWNKEEDTKKQLSLGILDSEETQQEIAPAKLTLTVANASNGLQFSWEAENVTAPNGFKVVRGTSENPTFPGNEYQYLNSSDAKNYTWQLQDGKTYHFRVCVYDGNECTLYSNDVTATAPQPVQVQEEKKEEAPTHTSPNVSAKAETSGVSLSWQDTSSNPGFIYYKVVRSETNSDLKYPNDGYIAVKSKGEESYLDTTAIKNKTYYYRICAVGDDTWCGEVTQIKAINTNSVPKAVTLSATYANKKVTLTWTKSTESDFKYYKIVWSNIDSTPTYPEDGYLVWEPLTTLTYTDAGQIAAGRETAVDLSLKTNYYSVCVVDQADQVTCSNTVTVKNGVVQ
ncbi:MAG: hypothetical protein COT25_05010 [Candidatus Kerfeldbacteria bacterium CG08_land_8_20_14_0_20_42_7]|uniref:Fibronectin type-III domain-containing protein n=1 Tax=Candidatus Kerfeldbacteria bacterium CG08_land_8_20_14_0_20_42_7 TaxID=2014245 RepID=A0A2H0YRF3_9BACT|nr:MAG: hypothetical protein COT25_05010 [Candidatus Kerfeldbacteria bacterium CG08_land_8_20_14_0_20_42_7]